MAGIEDCYTSSTGSRKTLGNFVKATFFALSKTYGFLTPDLWRETKYSKNPLQVRMCRSARGCCLPGERALDAGVLGWGGGGLVYRCGRGCGWEGRSPLSVVDADARHLQEDRR